MLNRGVDVNMQGSSSSSALMAASVRGNLDLVNLLLDRGANSNPPFDETHGSLLFHPARQGMSDAIKTLINRGSNIDAKSGILQAAAEMGHASVVQILIENGADVNATTEWYRMSKGGALQYASKGGHKHVVETLLKASANFNAQYKYGKYQNALHIAANYGNEGVVQMLLDAGAEVNHRCDDDYKSLALQAAGAWIQSASHERIAQLLRSRGAVLPSRPH